MLVGFDESILSISLSVGLDLRHLGCAGDDVVAQLMYIEHHLLQRHIVILLQMMLAVDPFLEEAGFDVTHHHRRIVVDVFLLFPCIEETGNALGAEVLGELHRAILVEIRSPSVTILLTLEHHVVVARTDIIPISGEVAPVVRAGEACDGSLQRNVGQREAEVFLRAREFDLGFDAYAGRFVAHRLESLRNNPAIVDQTAMPLHSVAYVLIFASGYTIRVMPNDMKLRLCTFSPASFCSAAPGSFSQLITRLSFVDIAGSLETSLATMR